jgi:hypothetical protein
MLVAETIRPEDVVVGLLAEVWRKRFDRFKADPVSVHSRFYEWRERPELADLFGKFVFDTRDYFPYSETLDRVFDGLQLAGYLERTNPRGTFYVIRPAMEKLFKKDIQTKFKGPQRKALEALAVEFVKDIKTERRPAL